MLTWEKELMHLTPGASGCDGELSPQPEGEVTEARGSEVAGRSPRHLEWWPVRGVLIVDPGALAKDVCAPSSGLHMLPGYWRPLSHGGLLGSGTLKGRRTALAWGDGAVICVHSSCWDRTPQTGAF